MTLVNSVAFCDWYSIECDNQSFKKLDKERMTEYWTKILNSAETKTGGIGIITMEDKIIIFKD